jgi:hypothetical protein
MMPTSINGIPVSFAIDTKTAEVAKQSKGHGKKSHGKKTKSVLDKVKVEAILTQAVTHNGKSPSITVTLKKGHAKKFDSSKCEKRTNGAMDNMVINGLIKTADVDAITARAKAILLTKIPAKHLTVKA